LEKIIIEGGGKLSGTVHISGAKNAVLPLIAAALLTDGVCEITETPWLTDVKNMCEVLEYLGAETHYEDSTLYLNTANLSGTTTPYEQVRKMRASILVMGPLLAKMGSVTISLPGGCNIGARPIDLHLKGFEAMGAHISLDNNGASDVITAHASRLHGARIYLNYPSVGATENLMMAAALAEGITILENVAQEPEIVDLSNFLNAMGAKIKGAGTNTIRITGVKTLKPVNHAVIPDRIEAGSFMLMAAITHSEIFLENIITEHMTSIIAKMGEAGIRIIDEIDGIRVLPTDRILPTDIKTMPYPGFPTDMQAQFMALMALAEGTSIITETVFENRFMHVAELNKMGANIRIDDNSAVVSGVRKLTGAAVNSTDLRAGAAMVIAGLAADGITEIGEIQHIYRGYERLIEKLAGLGAKIRIK
jgi:UDP-N-acetylglucosamine 1-carboxyvinyltransferase